MLPLQKPLGDDLALLVTQVRRLPEDATATWELTADPASSQGYAVKAPTG
ncbi:hypothetical protein [Streptomyces tibetensis]|uniref:Uncharacterized protein n=1 Tax=Streptomyces tibetensis TaxID=2382123 RepID=A0ABW6MMT5_9ACTN